MFATGEIEFEVANEPLAVNVLCDVYLDIESRSWKNSVHAGVSRSPERVAFFKHLLTPCQPATPSMQLLERGGLPIAAFLTLRFSEVVYGMEMSFDEVDQDLAPGNVLMLLTISEAAAAGAKAFNMLGNFAYHKSRWKAQITETSAVQVFRRGSRAHLKALAGNVRRKFFGPPKTQLDAERNLSRALPGARVGAGVGEGAGSIARRFSTLLRLWPLAAIGQAAAPALQSEAQRRESSRHGYTSALRKIASDDLTVERWSGATLAKRLPFRVPGFDVEKAAPVKANFAKALKAGPRGLNENRILKTDQSTGR